MKKIRNEQNMKPNLELLVGVYEAGEFCFSPLSVGVWDIASFFTAIRPDNCPDTLQICSCTAALEADCFYAALPINSQDEAGNSTSRGRFLLGVLQTSE